MRNFEQMVKTYNDTKYQIRRLVLKQQELRELGGFPNTCANDGMPKSPNRSGSPIENFIIALCELEEQQMSLENTLECLRNDISIVIDYIPNFVTREIVSNKVFIRASWRTISHKVNYSISRVRQLYYEGIVIINNSIKENAENRQL